MHSAGLLAVRPFLPAVLPYRNERLPAALQQPRAVPGDAAPTDPLPPGALKLIAMTC